MTADTGGARAAVEQRELTDRFADACRVHDFAADVDLDLAFGDDVHQIRFFAFAHQRLARAERFLFEAGAHCVDVLEERLPREEKVPQRAVDELDLFRVLMANGTAGR